MPLVTVKFSTIICYVSTVISRGPSHTPDSRMQGKESMLLSTEGEE